MSGDLTGLCLYIGPRKKERVLLASAYFIPTDFVAAFMYTFIAFLSETQPLRDGGAPTNKLICLILKLFSSNNALGLLNFNFKNNFS